MLLTQRRSWSASGHVFDGALSTVLSSRTSTLRRACWWRRGKRERGGAGSGRCGRSDRQRRLIGPIFGAQPVQGVAASISAVSMSSAASI
jgi:hypothetical protein